MAHGRRVSSARAWLALWIRCIARADSWPGRYQHLARFVLHTRRSRALSRAEDHDAAHGSEHRVRLRYRVVAASWRRRGRVAEVEPDESGLAAQARDCLGVRSAIRKSERLVVCWWDYCGLGSAGARQRRD